MLKNCTVTSENYSSFGRFDDDKQRCLVSILQTMGVRSILQWPRGLREGVHRTLAQA